MTCETCDDGEGGCVFPYYGVAPHVCGFKRGLPALGSSVQLPEDEWPENFEPDPDAPPGPNGYPGFGVYTNCPICGAGATQRGPA